MSFLIILELIDKVFNPDSLVESFYEIRKNVRFKKSVQEYCINLFQNVFKTCDDFSKGIYSFKPLYEFNISERGKRRLIKATNFYDRVPIHALCSNILNPILKRYIIYDNCASIKGRGIDMQRKRVMVHLQKYYRHHGNNGYVLQGDFKNFFGSFKHDKVLSFLNNKFEKETIDYISKWMKQYGDVGVGIGGEPSQILGVAFPTRIDNYIKTVCRCKYYGRYMDDFYIFHNDKDFLLSVLKGIRKEANELGLELNEKKTHITKISKSFTFLKIRYCLTDSGKVIMRHTKDTFVRERRKLKKYKKKMENGQITYNRIEGQFKSWYGNVSKFSNYKSCQDIRNLFYSLYPQNIRKEYQNG